MSIWAQPQNATRRIALRRLLALAGGIAAARSGMVSAQAETLIANKAGGYRFLPGSPVFASGAIADAGHEMVHVILRRALALPEGYAAIERFLASVDRPLQALTGIELRAPRQMTLEEFGAFNKGYVEQLRRWDVFVEEHNPISRVNVTPKFAVPSTASLHAFSYCTPRTTPGARVSFVMAGIADVGPEGVIARGDTSTTGMRTRLAFLVQRVDERLAQLGVTWSDVTQTDLYSVHDIQALAQTILLPRLGEAAQSGMRWYAARPPVVDTEAELDVRAVYREIVLDAR